MRETKDEFIELPLINPLHSYVKVRNNEGVIETTFRRIQKADGEIKWKMCCKPMFEMVQSTFQIPFVDWNTLRMCSHTIPQFSLSLQLSLTNFTTVQAKRSVQMRHNTAVLLNSATYSSAIR